MYKNRSSIFASDEFAYGWIWTPRFCTLDITAIRIVVITAGNHTIPVER